MRFTIAAAGFAEAGGETLFSPAVDITIAVAVLLYVVITPFWLVFFASLKDGDK